MPAKEDTRGAGKRTATKSSTKAAKKAAKKGTKKAPKPKTTAARESTVKRVQGHRDGRDWFEIRNSKIHGKGAFAIRDVPKGTRFAEYVGQKIKPEVAWERYDDDTMETHHTFLFTLDDDTLVDAGVGGNDTRFINHSCDPNCRSSTEDGHIYFDAIKDIPKGTELTYDYRLTREGRYQKHWDELYKCRCGSPKCRGTILLRRRRKAKS